MSHSGTIYGPRYLLDKNLILVTLNFRLGVLGFLSTGDGSATGNFQLKDQLSAFNWVVDHISRFGGNSKKITLMGESTGAGAAALHLISPLTSSQIPRFHCAILFSGSSFNHWATMNRDTLSNTKLLAERMRCPTQKSSKELVKCLRRRDPYMVVGQQLNIWRIPVISRLVFGPVVEQDHPGAFMVESPQQIYQSNQSSSSKVMPVPVIAGINKDEGSLFAANVYLVPFLFNYVSAQWAETMAFLMAFDNIPGVSVPEISKKISEFYFNGKTKWSYQNLREIGNALGDRTINTGVYSFLQKHSQLAPTFGYKFAHSGSSALLKHMGLAGEEWGVSHGDELPLIFSMKDFFDDTKSPRDLAVSRFLIEVIATFANDGRPVPTSTSVDDDKVIWNPVLNPEQMEILEIREENKKLVPFPFKERMKFWEKLDLN